ncbi:MULTISPECIES: type II toxin-antitoxin system tRNA(fMet)-specific endonuclease VapC [unclassified Tolypothrix]|uniref:type II toxin-antitoxin system tRNA(fMet)-specific endonuclease VapC n=1 Tax=unclassified Tolypothrix TaxID=2649714 RepID=UPI0005EAC005|nr:MULTISPECIES: type II toxin-antitoxin system VapC family toxin [unclassified Tolypothrix]BAY95775.1 PilT protein domain protein [Microchaete diplosiphon NIES-3275]EKE98204.1 toxin-antitoxin system, toxin component, PIN family [Tolypothrix sp. PCC 7601]MBE9087474.1 type II toxin-antitoxin system VapC family toxin [Tolypothrix sp. LEGE 11397]UYD30782.1 type II toxin-antitoxin system VapC family toxin [Tolypothrix sp. PCC 7712]UYD38700.1 type II toxin-antitoxin system VapC family toxin [Tolypo
MKFLLDTNTCIIYLRGKNATLKQKLESTATKDIAVCSIVKAELFYGSMKSANPQRNLSLQQQFLAQFTSLPFDDLAAMTFGTIRSQLEVLGTPIGAYDLQIAAIALTNNLTLITHNTREFQRINNLVISDWEIDI